MSEVRIETVPGPAIGERIADVARLRIAVFRDWPYLYDGDAAYDAHDLQTYTRAPESAFVLASDGARVIGASTGIPLDQEALEFQAPFIARGIDPSRVFYCGESVLLPSYRGRGIGHAFFDAREAHARALGRFDWIAFAAVDRDDNDPRRPTDHRGNEAFWTKRGYARQPDMTMHMAWKEIGEHVASDKVLTFWLRPLEKLG